jgi:protein-disulfide isomerase
MENKNQSLSVPVAIIVAGALIAFGIYMSGRSTVAPVATNNAPAKTSDVPAITANDHVLGDRKAPITMVVYSDIECPFCKRFHDTTKTIVTEYKGKVAVAFRHFPVHQNSVKEGEAVECAAEVGGNDAFWKYLDVIFAETKSNNGIDLARLPGIASEIGLDVTKFNACLASGKYVARVQKDQADVIKAGAQGTPYTVIFAPNGQKVPITQGALPYADMKRIIDTVVSNS